MLTAPILLHFAKHFPKFHVDIVRANTSTLTQMLRDRAVDALRQYPVASIPLSDELARVLIERYGEQAHPDVLVNYSSDEISHLIQVTEHTDTLLLAIRACAPELVEVKVSPPLNDQARFGLVTLANKAEALYLREIRKLMTAIFT